MSKFSVTLAAATLAELYESAAAFASSGHAPSAAPINYSPTTTIAPTGDDDGAPDTNAPAVDKTGIPWDDRIHSSSKKLGADGTWNRRRNTPDAKYDQVMAELRARVQQAAPPVMQQTAPPVMTQPVMQQAAPPVMQQAAPPVMTQPVMQQAAPPVMQQAAPDGMAFGQFMPLLSNAMQEGKFTNEELAGWLAQWQIVEIGHLMNDPVKTLNFYNWIKAAGRIA